MLTILSPAFWISIGLIVLYLLGFILTFEVWANLLLDRSKKEGEWKFNEVEQAFYLSIFWPFTIWWGIAYWIANRIRRK